MFLSVFPARQVHGSYEAVVQGCEADALEALPKRDARADRGVRDATLRDRLSVCQIVYVRECHATCAVLTSLIMIRYHATSALDAVR